MAELIRIVVAKKIVITVSELEDVPSLTSSRPSATLSPSPPIPPVHSIQPRVAIKSPLLTEAFGDDQENHRISPFKLPPLIEIHTMLSTSAFTSPSNSPFDWDLTTEPRFLRTEHSQVVLPYALTEPAVSPYTEAITIRSQRLLWKIDVVASHGIRVTVHDVFHAIYHNLRTPITLGEYNSMKADPQNLKTIIQAYEARYRAITDDPAARELEKKKGIKRIDMLTKHVKFAGLSATEKPNEFVLQVCTP